MSIQSEKVRQYFLEKGLRYREIERRYNINPSVLSNFVNEKSGLGRKVACQLHDAFGFSIPFLLTGEGELFAKPTNHNEVQGASHCSVIQAGNNSTINAGDAVGALLKAQDETMQQLSFLRKQLEAKEQEYAALKEQNAILLEKYRILHEKNEKNLQIACKDFPESL